MKKTIEIGKRKFSSKKEALVYYKTILNAYDFGQSLNNSDYNDLLALLNYEYQLISQEEEKETGEEDFINCSQGQDDAFVEDIRVAKVQFKTKCFEVFMSDKTSYYTSYIILCSRARLNLGH